MPTMFRSSGFGPSLLIKRYQTAEQTPLPWQIISVTLSLITLVVICLCITRRIPSRNRWRKLPPVLWLLILIYFDSFIFIFISTVLRDLGLNSSVALCQGAILLCLTCYLTIKVLLYLFLVEKAYIVRARAKKRLQDKIYLFNAGVLMIPFGVVAVLNFVYRIGYINENGRCIIGMENKSLIPLAVFDVVANVYLTTLFLVPLRNLYSYKTAPNPTLRSMVMRTFLGSCLTLASCVTNLVISMALHGEPGWVCLFCCNLDVLFDVLVLHWVTVTDKNKLEETLPTNNSQRSRSTISQITEKRSTSIPIKTSLDSKTLNGSTSIIIVDATQTKTTLTEETELKHIDAELKDIDERKQEGAYKQPNSASSSTDAIIKAHEN